MSEKEKVLFENNYGLVSDRRVVLKQKLGYDSIPIEKVVSVSLGHQRNYVAISIYFGLIIAIIALVVYMVSNAEVGHRVIAPTELMILCLPLLILFVLGLIQLMGYYFVQLTIEGHEKKMVKVSLFRAKDARLLVEAANRKIFESKSPSEPINYKA